MAIDIEYALMAGRAYHQNGINWFPIPQGWSEFFHVRNSTTPTTSGDDTLMGENFIERLVRYEFDNAANDDQYAIQLERKAA